MTKIFILHKDKQTWNEINESELDKWIEDGSIEERDLIVYPKFIERLRWVKVSNLEEVK